MLATENSLRKIALIFAVAGVVVLSGCAPAGPRALVRGDELLQEGKPAEAIEKLKRAIELLPNEPRAWNLLGLAYHRAGQPQLAAQAYRQALVKDRSNLVAVAHYNLGCLLLEQGNLGSAADELRSFTLITNSAAGFVKLATVQLRMREFANAERNFNSALKLDSKNAEALNGVGVIHAYRNQRDAVQYFNSALQANPKYSPALLNAALLAQQNPATRATALSRFRDYLALTPPSLQADAVKLLVRQLESDAAPTHAVAAMKSNALMAALQATNALKTNGGSPRVVAVTNAKPAVTLTKTNELAALEKTNLVMLPPAKTNRLVAVTNTPPVPEALPVTIVAVASDTTPKIAPAQPVTSAERTNASVPLTEASADSTNGRDFVRIAAPAQDEEKKPGFFARLNPFRDRPKPVPVTNEVPRAVVLSPRTNMLPPAKAEFPRYAYLSPAAPSRAGNRVDAERAMTQAVKAQRAGNTNEALLDYQLALGADPTYFDAHYNLALLMFQMGELKRALAGWEMALALQPDSINARYNFALALKQGDYAHEAAQELQRILEAKPNEVRAHLTLGNLYAQQLNEPQKARPHYLKVVELEPRNPQAPAIRYWLAANP